MCVKTGMNTIKGVHELDGLTFNETYHIACSIKQRDQLGIETLNSSIRDKCDKFNTFFQSSKV